MNREIKIRVWDTVAGVWLPQDDIGIDNLGNVYLFTEDTGELDGAGNFIWKCTLLKHSDRYKVMQFTGLTDKHGREIYEGDIVRHRSGQIERVRFNSVTTAFDPIPSSFELEVIGNLHENAELLEEAA